MGAEGLPPPKAEGSLAKRPFAHLLLYVHQQELTGTLVVWPEQTEDAPQGQDRILFQGGIALAGRLLSPASALDRGMLPLFSRVDAPYAFYEANLLGSDRKGIVAGRVDPITLLTASLRGAAREDAIEDVLSRFGETKLRLTPRIDMDRFGFEKNELAFVELIRAEPAPVAELVKAWGDERTARRLLYLLAITKCVEPFEGRRKKPSRNTIERLTRSGRHSTNPGKRSSPGARKTFRSGAASAESTASPPRPSPAPPKRDDGDDWFDEIPPERHSAAPASPSGAPAPRSSKSSSPGGAASPAPKAKRSRKPAEPEPPPDPPAGLSKAHAELWSEIQERAKKLDEMNYYDMLGIDRSASASTVRDAYFALAKKMHPDRLPSELEALKPWVDQVFHHATKARDTLSDEQKRAEYLKTVQEGGGTPAAERELNAIVTAAMAVQRVEVLVRRREWLEGLQTLDEALELNPQDSDAHTMKAWVLFQRNPDKAPYSQIHACLDTALEINPRNAKAHHHKGVVLKRQGKEDEALTHFRMCAEIDPKNIDAAREVRLADMRRAKGRKKPGASKDKDSGGVFSKLFGKK